MKISVFLANRFIKAHKLTALLSVIIISLFIAAFEATLIYNDCYQGTLELNLIKAYGRESGIIYSADITSAMQYLSEDDAEESGMTALSASYKISGTENYYIGYMPQKALYNKATEMILGRLPENGGEAAVEQSAYNALGLTANIGDTFSVTVTENGKEITKCYTLCGITENYLLRWQQGDSSKKSFNCPPPVIITSYNEADPDLYINLMCDKKPEDFLGGDYSQRGIDYNNVNVVRANNSVYFVTSPMAVIFALVMVFGVYSVLKYTMDERDRYLKLLQKIGMTRNKCGLTYMVMGVYLVTASCVLGSLLGVFVSFAASKCFTALSTGQELIFVYRIENALIGCLICAAIILFCIMMSVRKFYSKKKLKKTFRRKTTEPYTQPPKLSRLVKRSRAIHFLSQNIVTGMLMAFCVIISGFGLYFSLESVMRSDTSVVLGTIENEGDIELYVSGGSSAIEYYFINQPDGSGISPESLNDLLSDSSVSFRTRVIAESIGCAVVYKKGDNIEYFENQIKNPQISQEITEDKVPTCDYLKSIAEIEEGDRMFSYGISGSPTDAIIKRYFSDDPEANAIRDGFINGSLVVAASEAYKIGDKIKLVTISTADSTCDVNNPDRFNFAVTEATVAAVVDNATGIEISTEYLESVHPSAKYFGVTLDIESDDEKDTERVTALAESIAARSQYVSVRNNIKRIEEYHRLMAGNIISSLLMILIFTTLTAAAVVVSAKLRTRVNLNSFMLMRAIGADDKTILSLSIKEGILPCVIGAAISYAISSVFSYIMCSHYSYLPLFSTFIISILTSAAVAVVIILLCVFVSYKEIKLLLKM